MAVSGKALFDRRCKLTIANPATMANPTDGQIVDPYKDYSKTFVDVIEINGGTTDNRDVLGLRIKFKIDKTLKKQPNTSEITVTNLSPTRRASLQKKGVKVLFEAGYKELGLSRYFAGDVRTIDHVRDGADWNTVIKLGDGERAWKYARVSESHAPGTRAADVIKSLGKALGLDLGNLDDQVAGIDAVFDGGFAAVGSASKAFDRAIQAVRKSWSIQDGELQILDPYSDEVLDLPIPEITPDTGLIGSPEMGAPKKKGGSPLVHFTSLLIPTKPGAKVKLVSNRYDGYVRVESCSFTGDTSGGDWYSVIDGTVLR